MNGYSFVGMHPSRILLLFFLSFNISSSSSLSGRLYGIAQSSFVEIIKNSRDYIRLLNLGRASLSGPATAMKSVDNKDYVVTYHIFDALGVPHYYFLTISVDKTPKLKSNLTITGSGSGSFWQIADDQTQIVGIRESFHPGTSLEVATIDLLTAKVQTLGFYPYGSYNLVMAFARQLYDEIEDRLISLVYSSTVVQNAWFIASIIINKDLSNIKFERIGQSTIPMGDKYLWSTTYTLALKERQWVTLWSTTNDGDNNVLINFDIDKGDITEKQIINNSKYLNNLVYFD